MGVYPEPALCADDVSRLVPNGSYDAHNAARKTTRITSLPTSRLSGRALATFLLGASLAAASPAVAGHDGAGERSAIPYGLHLGDSAGDWGDEPLLDREPTALAIIEGNQSDPSKPRSADGEEVVRFGDKSVPRDLVTTIVHAAETSGVDPVYMMALADKESNFDPDVKNAASSAQGLFQFVTGTWLEMIRDHGAKYGYAEEAASVGKRAAVADAGMRKRILALRNDPYVAGLMAGELIKRDRARIESRIGRQLKTTELYLAHFLGTASAGKFLSLSADDPETVASSAFRGAARANRSLFVAKDGGKRRSLTVAELHTRIDGMIDKRISQYEDITKLVAPAAQVVRTVDTTPPAAPLAMPVLDARLRINDQAIPAAE